MSLQMLKQIFNPNDIAKSFETLEPLKSAALDTFFKKKVIHPSPFIPYSEIKQKIRSVPVVRRDGIPVSLNNTDLDVELFAPLPIKVDINVSAAELNDLRSLMGSEAAVCVSKDFSFHQLEPFR